MDTLIKIIEGDITELEYNGYDTPLKELINSQCTRTAQLGGDVVRLDKKLDNLNLKRVENLDNKAEENLDQNKEVKKKILDCFNKLIRDEDLTIIKVNHI